MVKRIGNGNGGLCLGGGNGHGRHGNGYVAVDPPIMGRCWKEGGMTEDAVGVKQSSGLHVLLKRGGECKVPLEFSPLGSGNLNRLRLLAGRELKPHQKKDVAGEVR